MNTLIFFEYVVILPILLLRHEIERVVLAASVTVRAMVVVEAARHTTPFDVESARPRCLIFLPRQNLHNQKVVVRVQPPFTVKIWNWKMEK